MDQVTTIEKIKQEYTRNIDNLNWLSKSVIDLAVLSFNENINLANAELQERKAYLDFKSEFPKASIEECKGEAVTKTENLYGRLKLNRDSLDEFINALKLRIRVLMTEKDTALTNL